MTVTLFAFYLFSITAVMSALFVVVARNPVHAVLWLILTFFSAASMFVLMGAEFVAMLLAIVYVGAVAVLFLFVVMMLDVDFVELKSGMQKSFTTQPELFVSSTDLEHPVLHALDDTESLLDWTQIEHLLSSIYASKTGCPSYPLLTLFRSLLLGVWYRLSDVQLAQCLYRDLLFRKFCHLELGANVPEASTIGRDQSTA